jgi:hypothetical protein
VGGSYYALQLVFQGLEPGADVPQDGLEVGRHSLAHLLALSHRHLHATAALAHRLTRSVTELQQTLQQVGHRLALFDLEHQRQRAEEEGADAL